jgi:predicted Zn-dependent peptidase
MKQKYIKPLFIFSLGLLVFTQQLLSQNPLQHKYFRMKNGLQVFLKTKPLIPLVNMVLTVNIGSKDESNSESGLVHLMEHLLMFSGTESHTRYELIRLWRQKGCYVNAHTDHDLMTFEISCPGRQAEYCLSLLKEKVFKLKPQTDDLLKEKQIIAEEINQMQDDVFQQGTDRVLNLLFPDHPYANPIYGQASVVKNARLDQIQIVYNRYFRPSNCSLAVVGDFDLDEMENHINLLFADLKPSAVSWPAPAKAKPLTRNRDETMEMDIEQAMLIIGFSAPEFNHKDQFALSVLGQILGKGPNPLLGVAIRSRKKLSASFSARYIKLKYTGAFLVYLRTDPKKIKLLKRQVTKFLNRTNTFRYAKTDFLKKDQHQVIDYLESARNNIKLSSEEFKEKGINSAISFGRFMLLKNPGKQINYQQEMQNVSAADLRRVASKYLCGKPHATVYILPLKKNERP